MKTYDPAQILHSPGVSQLAAFTAELRPDNLKAACVSLHTQYLFEERKPSVGLFTSLDIPPREVAEASASLLSLGWLLPKNILEAFAKLPDKDRANQFGDTDPRLMPQLLGFPVIGHTETQLAMVSFAQPVPGYTGPGTTPLRDAICDMVDAFRHSELLEFTRMHPCMDVVGSWALSQDFFTRERTQEKFTPLPAGVRWHWSRDSNQAGKWLAPLTINMANARFGKAT